MKKCFRLITALLLVAAMLVSCSARSTNANKITPYDVENASYKLSIDAKNEIKDISELLYGIFFEDINFAADGGLYAEMVANRSFEFTELAADDQMFGWSAVNGAEAEVKINASDCLNENNTNFLVIKNNGTDLAGVQNRGFLEGMAVDKKDYKFSVYSKALNGYSGAVTVRLVAGDEVVAEGKIDSVSAEWKKYDLELDAKKKASENVFLQLLIDDGEIAVDMVSLFPEDTFKGRENGVRNDIGTMLEELQPKFLRFPGGCVIEGYDENTAYNWKASVGADKNGEPLEFNGKYGDVAARRQGIDLWTDINATDDEYPSFMSYGLGFYEFFCLSEDIGAVGVPVLNCGLFCQARGGKAVDIKSDDFKKYIQDMLDLVEFCRGDISTKWGKVRASLGHDEPFELRYICIGNENWGQDYFVRYNEFVKAFNKAKAQNPELYKGIELIYSSGTDDGTSNTDYIKAYEYASDKLTDTENNFAGAIDQHYYNAADWFLKHADYYDEANYSRSVDGMTESFGGKINVFLGEYASWSNRMYSALAESAYMTGLERNGDIVSMATYAPLLASMTARHWAPDLIWFNNQDAIGSVNYYTQMLFSRNQGTKLLDSSLDGAYIGDKAVSGRIGLGTWETSAKFDNLKIVDTKSGEVLAEESFDSDALSKFEQAYDGAFEIKDGALFQTSEEIPTTDFGTVLYYGDKNWDNYTFTVDATKLSGNEGFFIPIFAGDDNIYFWNIGGYGNTVSCLQQFNYGYKTGQIEGTVKELAVEENKTYHLKVVGDGTAFKCYIDDELYIDYDNYSTAEAEAYQVVSTDESGDIIIKLVNMTGEDKVFAINIENAKPESEAKLYQVKADSLAFENIYGAEEQAQMTEATLKGISESFNFTAPKYSASVIRLERD